MLFAVTFAAVAVTAAQDIFEIVTPATTRAALREIELSQYTEFGDAAAELLSVQLIRGYTVSGSGGTAFTPLSLLNHAGKRAAVVTAEINNTTVANTGTAEVLRASSFNVASGWWYRPPADERIILEVSSRLVVRITAPADSVTMNGTLIFEELGRIPS